MTSLFENLIYLYETNLTRAIVITLCLAVILGLLLWVSIIDIKKHSIKFKYMLIASSSVIIMPFIASFFCGCYLLKWFLICALPLWIFFLFWNIKTNKDKFVGKADVDLLSAVISATIMYSLWIAVTTEYYSIRIIHTWYSLFLYLLIGGICYVIFYLLTFLYKTLFKKQKFMELMKTTKVPVVPMFIPVSFMMAYTFMVS